jgi:hypothetical protein
VLASLLGTYMDLLFVGKGLYQFPHRPLPELFSIHLGFTLIGLPLLTMMVLYFLAQANRWGKAGIIVLVSLLMPVMEKASERLGLFVHSEHWQHAYSFFGYLLFFMLLFGVYRWLSRMQG